MDKVRMFREAAQRHNEGRDRCGWRYPPELRALAIEYYESVKDGGVAPAAVALDISPMSLTEWLHRGPESSAAMIPVRVSAMEVDAVAVEQRLPALQAVTPGGLRLEGLDWARALDLVRIFG